MSAMNWLDAMNATYPLTDSPHTSVKQREFEARAAFYRGWQAATEAAKATGTAGEPEYCPACHGSGESAVMDGAGPYAAEVPCNCPHCNGTGALIDAYNGVVKLLAEENRKYLELRGKQWAAARQPAPSRDEIEGAFAIKVEKMLCEALGRQWSAVGISVEGLISELKSQQPAPVLAASEKDERDNEIFELQKALAFWLPQVNQFMSEEMSQRIAHDAYMLVIDGNLPDDFKTAEELHWILPATGKAQEGAEMVCGNCMEPITATNRSQP